MSAPSAPTVEVVRFADPWCWWSWCMEPVVRRLEEVYGDGIGVTYRMGGMFDDLNLWMQSEGVNEASAAEAIRAAGQAAGMPILSDYLWRCKAKTSHPACLAYKAAELQGLDLARRFFRRMMEAFMIEGRHGSYEAVLDLAREVGLQDGRLRKDMELPIVKAGFDGDLLAMRQPGAEYDGLLLRNQSGRTTRVQGFATKPYEDAIDALAPGLPKRRPADLIAYAEPRRTLLAAREVASVLRISDEAAEARLLALTTAGLFESSENGTLWRWKGPEPDPLPIDLLRAAYVREEVPAGASGHPILAAAVKSRYESVATRPDQKYRFPVGLSAATDMGYPAEELRKIPATAVESFSGVGYVFAPEGFERKDTVLDVGCGSGTDALLAAQKVAKGVVHGFDVAPAMVAKARRAAADGEEKGMRISEGSVSSIQVATASVDVVTSNGVLHLVPDKIGALREMFRVLRPGGRLLLADIVAKHDVRAAVGSDRGLWADGLGGAPLEEHLLQGIEVAAGFKEVRIVKEYDYYRTSSSPTMRRIARAVGARSVVVVATKPAEEPRRRGRGRRS